MYVEIGYHIVHNMPVPFGLPPVQANKIDSIKNGDGWNGTALSIYLHEGTHVDAPSHFIEGAPTIDEIPIDRFIYKNPLMIDLKCEPNHLISVQEVLSAGGEHLENADILFINTGFWEFRENDFEKYTSSYPSLSLDAARYLRNDLANLKAVAIDTLSLEDLKAGAYNGYEVHKAVLDPACSDSCPLLIYEDYDPRPIIGKNLKSAFVSPIRVRGGEAAVVNIVVEVE